MWIDQLRRDARSLHAMHDFTDRLEIVDHSSISEVDLADGAGVHLQRVLASDRVAPAHGEDGDLRLVDGREVVWGEFGSFGEEAEAVGFRFAGGHPDVGVGRVFDFRG